MAKNNLLLGNGQALVGATIWPTGKGGPPNVYSISESRSRLHPQLEFISTQAADIPREASPRDEFVGRVLVHPQYMAKSYMPTNVLRTAGLRHVGTRSATIDPIKRTRKKDADKPMLTAELLVAGSIANFKHLDQLLMQSTAVGVQQSMGRIESISLMSAGDRVRHIKPLADGYVMLECVLHASVDDEDIIQQFSSWVATCAGHAFLERRMSVDALTFLPARVPFNMVNVVANFSHLRVLRSISSLRSCDGALRTIPSSHEFSLPKDGPLSTAFRTAVFDGGLGVSSISSLVAEHTWPETERTTDDYLDHGAVVTSAFLFGARTNILDPLPRPFSPVDHYRIATKHDSLDIEMFEAVHRICEVLDQGLHKFINISLAPSEIVNDDDVHLWTSVLEKRLSSGQILAAVAVGNGGEKSYPDSRVQIPADLVNALAVGSSTSESGPVVRASHSSVGPGRSPGLVKPDGLAWGHEVPLFEPRTGKFVAVNGSSVASPLALRTCVGAAAMADNISPRIARALLIHTTERSKHPGVTEVGHGRFASDPLDLLSCSDREAMVVYEGQLEPSTPVGAMLPWPTGIVAGKVRVRATLVFYTAVDVAHPINYTRAGIEARLRQTPGGQTKTFFSRASLYGNTEQEMRGDAHKWETVVSKEISADASVLNDPTLELIYRARDEGHAISNEHLSPLPYVLVVTIGAQEEADFYNRIRQRHAVLTPVRLRAGISLPARA
jgi:hypothetical protein